MAGFKSNMRGRAREAANARKNQATGNSCLRLPEGAKVEFMSIDKDCTLRLDVIPYVVKDKHHPDRQHGAEVDCLWHSRRYFIHRDVGSDNRAFICPNKTWGKPCPICDYAKQRRKEGASKKELDSYWPKEKMLYNIIDTEADKNKMLLYDVSYHNFTKQLDRELVEGEEDWGGFAELKNGYTLKARFAMETFNKNSFAKCDRIDFVPRKYDYDERDVEDALCLDDLLIEVPYNELEEIFMNGDIGSGADQGGDDSRERGRGGRDREERGSERGERSEGRGGRDRGRDDGNDRDNAREERGGRRERSRDDRETSREPEKGSEDERNDDDDRGSRRGRGSRDEESSREERSERGGRRSRGDDDKDDRDSRDSKEDREERGGRRSSRDRDDDKGRDNDRESDREERGGGRRSSRDDDKDSRDDRSDREERGSSRRGGRDDDRGSGSDGDCPFDHKFGKDLDKYSDCDDCKNWGACRDANAR